jgi:uncharacterized protein
VVVNTIGVNDIDGTIARAKEAGAKVAVEKVPIPGAGWVAYLLDPNGVVFGVYVMDETAGQ